MTPVFWIVLLIVLGLILFFAELVLLPGITLAAIGSFCCLVVAASWAFTVFGLTTGFLVLGGIVAAVCIMLALFLRPKTWNRVALHTEIKDTIDKPIEELCSMGAVGMALTKLSPMGKVVIDAKTYEAKTMGQYVDEGSQIEVIGFENQNLIIKLK